MFLAGEAVLLLQPLREAMKCPGWRPVNCALTDASVQLRYCLARVRVEKSEWRRHPPRANVFRDPLLHGKSEACLLTTEYGLRQGFAHRTREKRLSLGARRGQSNGQRLTQRPIDERDANLETVPHRGPVRVSKQLVSHVEALLGDRYFAPWLEVTLAQYVFRGPHDRSGAVAVFPDVWVNDRLDFVRREKTTNQLKRTCARRQGAAERVQLRLT